MEKKGQATLFVVVALVIAILVVVAILISPKKLLIDIRSDAEKVKNSFEDCLEEKLSFAVTRNDVIAQPSLLLAKDYLERYANDAAVQCSDFSAFKWLTISGDKSKIKSTVTFNGADFNSVTRVEANVNYLITITRGDKKETIDRFQAGVEL